LGLWTKRWARFVATDRDYSTIAQSVLT
jgi:hypothetical protein